MKSFLSVIYLQTHSVSGEKIAVALLAIGEEGIFFQSSDQKLKLAAKLSGEDATKHAAIVFDFIENKVAESNKELKADTLLKTDNVFNKEYIQYLNKYSKGLLQFDAPKSFAGTVNKKIFKNLFQQFIGAWEENTTIHKQHQHFSSVIKKQLKKEAFIEKADIEYTLQPEKIPGLLLPQEVTLISKNGNILAAQAIDFSTSVEVIGKHAYELEVMIHSLEKFGELHINKHSKGSYYLLFNPPAKGSPQEKLLNDIKHTKAGLMTIEEAAYLDELEEKLKQEEYGKFSLFAEAV